MELNYPDDLHYADSHEYVRVEGNTATIGISAFAIDQLGDIVFLELPEVGGTLTQGEAFGTVESVKAVEDLKAPLSGKIIACNDAMVDAPETLVDDPYSQGWLIEIEMSDRTELEKLLTAKDYHAIVEGQ